MAQALIAEVRFQSRANPREVYDVQSGNRTGSPPSNSVFPPAIAFHKCFIIISILILLLPEGQAGEAWETWNKAMLFGSIGQKRGFTLLCSGFSRLKDCRTDEVIAGVPKRLWFRILFIHLRSFPNISGHCSIVRLLRVIAVVSYQT